MANLPLMLDWGKLSPDRDDETPAEVVVVADGEGEAAPPPSDAFSVAELSDQRLQENIERPSNTIADGLTSRLPDRGKKLQSSPQQLKDEFVWREKGRNQRVLVSDTGECERFMQPNATETSSSTNDFNENSISSKSPSLYSFRSFEKLEDKADAAFDVELRFLGHGEYRSSNENRLQMHEGSELLQASPKASAIFCRELPPQYSVGKGQEIRSIIGCGDIESSCISTLNGRRKLCKRFSKRSRGSERWNSSDWEFRKVQDVVLLDDEDVQPLQQTERDVHVEWKECKIYYPSRNDPKYVELSYSDLKCLDPESYLSSTIMNFYAQYLQRSLSSVSRPRDDYFVFSTYFYNKLQEAVSNKDDSIQCFSKLRRWWKGVNIFQKAYTFLPIHGDQHWSLAIICISEIEEESGPIVLHLDSLGLHSSHLIFSTVKCYLREEWNYMNQNGPLPDLPISERIWKHLPRIVERKITVPKQKNQYDCGLFVIYFMERFIRDAPKRLRKKDLSMFSSKWFKPEEASSLRNKIREQLIEEFEKSVVAESLATSLASSGSSGNIKDPFGESSSA